jgi:hypothetical protein
MQQNLFDSPQTATKTVGTRTEMVAKRDAAIKRAVDHADRVRAEWSANAFQLFKLYAHWNPGKPFLTEDVREFARTMDHPEPPDSRAWGAVAVKAYKQGFVKRAGYAAAGAQAHGRPSTLWVSV